jgi:hypothetical protein
MANVKPASAEEFDKNNYIVVRNFIEQPLLQVVHRYMLMKSENQQLSLEHKQVPDTPSMYADPLIETLMELALPRIEELTDQKLYPTYSYYRIYKQGDVLSPHIDRPSCEISFSLCVGYDVNNVADSNYQWPIYIDNSCDYRKSLAAAKKPARHDEGAGVLLNPGDCIIYRGCEVRHWRHAFEGLYQAQAFSHYVDQNGPYAKYKFDTRPMLGATAENIRDKGPYRYFPSK